jgi:cytidylate kinase
VAPLRKADDAVEIESSTMTAAEVVARMADVIARVSAGPAGPPVTPGRAR